MPLKSRTAESKNWNTERKCLTCNKDLGAKAEDHDPWRAAPIFHCEGSTVAWQAKGIRHPHHTSTLWPLCFLCHQPLGCPKCAASSRVEVVCGACNVWGTLEALLEHGPLESVYGNKPGKPISSYPDIWQARYRHLQLVDSSESTTIVSYGLNPMRKSPNTFSGES